VNTFDGSATGSALTDSTVLPLLELSAGLAWSVAVTVGLPAAFGV
jgi:hypothetical protein